jgi:hypothetical protein
MLQNSKMSAHNKNYVMNDVNAVLTHRNKSLVVGSNPQHSRLLSIKIEQKNASALQGWRFLRPGGGRPARQAGGPLTHLVQDCCCHYLIHVLLSGRSENSTQQVTLTFF